ncbi:MAG: adenosylhomocysteinase [Deltaproteobacteria bacterium]|nr:adenosylhomocysteinase [Deltaproteobacteria bacterium]MCL5277860.1 adenosylhomocysteinase [Deltaproteobacteria bacterium]
MNVRIASYDVKDMDTAQAGKQRIEWAYRSMGVLKLVEKDFARRRPLKGLRVGACLHVTTETANLMRVLKAGGAEVSLAASNPLSTQDDVAAALVRYFGVPTFAIKGEDTDTYYRHIVSVLETGPMVTMDDGADLVSTVHTKKRALLKKVIGGTEETTTGVIRLRSMAKQKKLAYPIISVNDAYTKHLFDNRYGTGQSTIDGILRATNRLIAGSVFVVCGYGWCGRGVAMRAKGMGARVIITEVDPIRALEAVMDGYDVMPIADAARAGDIFVTVTGDTTVISRNEFMNMKDGAIVANSGHFNVELNLGALRSMARGHREVREFVEEYRLPNGRRIYVLADGRLVNLSAAEGHPSSVMDMSFANQALSVAYLKDNARKLDTVVYPVPEDIDRNIAIIKLRTLGISTDSLTPQQKAYLASWKSGT